MSLNNIEILGYNSLVNLSQINADEVNTDILTKSDPDISDAQFDTLFGISTAQTIQQQINGVTGNISTLQSQITTLNGEVNTLQSEMNTAQSDINTLQSEMNTAQSDINDLQTDVGVLYGFSATNTASIAGLVISQASQDVIITAHTASIGGLNGDVNSLDGRVDGLEVKTSDQSYGTFSGTTFARRINVTNTAGAGTAVYLASSEDSEFLYGLTASAPIVSTAGTSQLSSLLVNTVAEVTNDLTITNGNLFVTRNSLTSDKKIVLYDNTTGNDYDYLGFWTDSGTASKKFLNAEIDGITGSAFQWYAGNGAGNGRTLLKSLTSANETSFTPASTFLKSNGFSQQIQLIRDSANNIVRIDMLGDVAGVNQYDGQIIQQEGNGVDDNKGIMTIQSGGLQINALNTGVNMQATNSTLIQSGTTTTLTSGGETEINCVALDINATGAITLDSSTTFNLTSTNNTILGITNINATGASATSIGNTGALTLKGATSSCITTGNQTITSSGGDVLISGTDVRINGTGTSAGEFIVRANTNVDIKATTGNIVSDANTTHTLISGGLMSLTAGSGLECTTLDLGADMSFTSQNSLLFKAIDGFWTAQSNSNYYYQSGVNDYSVFYGNQTGSQFLETSFISGVTPQATIRSTTHKIRVESNVETLIGNDVSPTTIDGSVINLSGNTVQDVGFTNNMMPTSTIIQNVSATVPSGFLYCDGQAVSRTTYARLFASIGTTFGIGNGTTTFNVPNFKGAYLRGASSQVVNTVTYAGPAVGTAQQDSVLAPSNQGFWNIDAGGGGSSRQVRSRAEIASDPLDTGASQTTEFARQNTTENRVFNYSVYYYIRF